METVPLEDLLKDLQARRLHLGLRRDLSKEPEIFGRALRVKGLYVWGRAQSADSRRLSQTEWDLTLFNETDPEKIHVPEGFHLFRLRDLQEFPYLAVLRPVPAEEE